MNEPNSKFLSNGLPADQPPHGLRRFFFPRRARLSRLEKTAKAELKRLSNALEQSHRQLTGWLTSVTPACQNVQDRLDALRRYNEVGLRLAELQNDTPLEPERIRDLLQSLSGELAEEVKDSQADRHLYQKCLAELLGTLILADHRIAEAVAESQPASGQAQTLVQIPTDLLYQIYYALFPAERMIVVSGRRAGEDIALGAAFDVTGVASAGHVQADPTLLARALISMDLSGTHLAAWIHSHPGQGVQATFPSQIDLHQHANWIHDYSPRLLSAIMVQDRIIRFWGTALEARSIHLAIKPAGLKTEESNGYVFRLT